MPSKNRSTRSAPEYVRKGLLQAAKKGEGLETLASVVEKFIRLNGGSAGLAKMLSVEYAEARPGSLLRQRILEMIMRAWKYVDEKSGHVEELGILDDDDLAREFEHRLQQAGLKHDSSEPAGPDTATGQGAAEAPAGVAADHPGDVPAAPGAAAG